MDQAYRSACKVTTSFDDMVMAERAVRRDEREREEKDRDSMIAIAREFRGKRSFDQILAICLRTQALYDILATGVLDTWSTAAKCDDDVRCVPGAVYVAACRCPLRFVGDEPAFDPTKFLNLVLEHARGKGRA